MNLNTFLLSTTLLFLPFAAAADDGRSADGTIRAESPFARATPPRASVGGAYITLRNDGDANRLTGGQSPVAARVEIHEHTMTDGVMKMREIEGGLALPADETVVMEPGGIHVMLMELIEPLNEGETIPLALEFEAGPPLLLEVPVLAPGAMGNGHGKAKHDH